MKDWLLIQNYIPSLNTNIIWKWMGFTSIKERITFCVVLNKKIPAETIPILICNSVSLCIKYIIFLTSSILENFFYRFYLFQLIHFIYFRFLLLYYIVICNIIVRLVDDHRLLPRIKRNLWIYHWSFYALILLHILNQLSQPNFWYPRPHL